MNKIEKAKDMLYKHLKDKDRYTQCEGWNRIGELGWESSYGVYKDLSFHNGDDEYYFENSKGLRCEKTRCDLKFANKQPEVQEWFKKNSERGTSLFSGHIVIFHRGYVRYILEIVFDENTVLDIHKKNEIDKFFESRINYYVIDAEYILNKWQLEKDINLEYEILQDDKPNGNFLRP